jgi:prepilin-type N-terminal cleavage/methylation domain-containing protein
MKEMVLKKMALKAKNKKGFTLVEVIVVLVILAILMAIAVPALTGYIAKANNKAAEAEGRTLLTAVQTIASGAEHGYGTNGYPNYVKENNKLEEMDLGRVATEAGILIGDDNITGDEDGEGSQTITELEFDDNHKVELLKYITSSGKNIEYEPTTGVRVVE